MGASAYRGRSPRRRNLREHPHRGVVDGADFLAGERRHALARLAALPVALLEVLGQRGPGEHVDVPDGGDVPGDLRTVDGQRGPDSYLVAERRGEDLAGLRGLPDGVLEPLLL